MGSHDLEEAGVKKIARALAYGTAGWAYERVARGRPHYSLAWKGRKVPILPIYAVGGLVAEQLAPRLRGKPLLERAVVYGVVLTGLELFGCKLSEVLYGKVQWSYRGKCVDLKHAALWAALGLTVGAISG